MTAKILLVNPPIYDFAAYDFWLKPYGLLYICSGYVGDRKNRPVYAIRSGASGDITPKDKAETP